MNEGLKACVAVGFATLKLVIDVVEKKGTTAAIADLEKIASDVPAVVSNFSDLKAEVLALTSAANEEDLLASILAGVATVSGSTKIAAIVQAAVQLGSGVALNGYALYQAVKS